MPTPSGDSWEHLDYPDQEPQTHPVKPHYDAAGKWVCHDCRASIRLREEVKKRILPNDKTPPN